MMPLNDQEYKALLHYCSENIHNGSSVARESRVQVGDFVFKYDTVISLRSQLFQRHVRKTSYQYKRRGVINAILKSWQNGEHIASIAQQRGYSPYLLARVILGEMLPQQTINKESVPAVTNNSKLVAKAVKDTNLIENLRLRQEVEDCIQGDPDFSPFVDKVRQRVGLAYEHRLARELAARSLPFAAEGALRGRGLAKTPDALLEIPVGIRKQTYQWEGAERVDSEWHTIYWIDSKAMFGDPETFKDDHRAQMEGYVNRFGPGLVVYWFGAAASLVAGEEGGEDGPGRDVLVWDRFPDEVLLPHRELALPGRDWAAPTRRRLGALCAAAAAAAAAEEDEDGGHGGG